MRREPKPGDEDYIPPIPEKEGKTENIADGSDQDSEETAPKEEEIQE